MKRYETDFFWSFKDGEAKYENGITELFYENKKIGTVTAILKEFRNGKFQITGQKF